MTNTSTLSDGTRCTIDYKAHRLTVHANIGLYPETHREEPQLSTRSRRSRSPHAPAQRLARGPGAQRVPMAPCNAWLPLLTRSVRLISAPARARHHRPSRVYETCGDHAWTHLSARGDLSAPTAAPIPCKRSDAAPSHPTFRGRASGAAAGAPPKGRVVVGRSMLVAPLLDSELERALGQFRLKVRCASSEGHADAASLREM